MDEEIGVYICQFCRHEPGPGINSDKDDGGADIGVVCECHCHFMESGQSAPDVMASDPDARLAGLFNRFHDQIAGRE